MRKDPAGKPAPPGGFKTGGWYSGYQYWNGSFAPKAGQIHPASNQPGAGGDAPTFSAQDASFIQSQRIKANQIQSPTQISLPNSTATGDFVTGLSASVDQARKALENSIAEQQKNVDAQIKTLKEKEQQTLGEVKTLVTPFRGDLEEAERKRLFINQNFEENQTLINELDQLLTEGNELIRQQKEVTGLAAVRNPRIQKAMDDVAARAGVIEAVINARNGQIAVAENMIDRTVNAITADRADQISYYETILKLTREDILNLEDDSRKLAEEQLNIKKDDLTRAQATADYIKKLLIDPATASLLAEGGVKLTDSVEQINEKIANAVYAREVRDLSNEMTLDGAEVVVNPKDVPQDELRTLIDSRGQKHFYRVKEKAGKGTAGERAKQDKADLFNQIVSDIRNGITWDDLYRTLISVPGISTDDIIRIYQIYAVQSRYAPSREQQLEDLNKYNLIQKG